MNIVYQAGYKYQLAVAYQSPLPVPYPDDVVALAPFYSLARGILIAVRPGYAWDGPSGPTIDTPTFMRGSLVHDVLYQSMREGHILDSDENRRIADKNLRAICLQDGMSAARAWWVYQAVRKFGASSAARGPRPVLSAP